MHALACTLRHASDLKRSVSRHARDPGREADPRDTEVARLSRRQNSVVTRSQLEAAGLSRSAIAHRIARHRLHRIHPGVYLLGEPGTSSRITLFTAAVYACGAHALLS